MSQLTRIRSAILCSVLLATVAIWTGTAAAQTTDRPVLGTAEITGNDVYVRSGGSMNHYTVCKLNAGARVTVLSERGNWYEILPPKAAFSLIACEYIDTADQKLGVVNGNNVRVRAGSDLNKSKYTVQTMLSKGTEVEILGESPDGFLRIKPPKNATLWISRDYVQLVSESSNRPEVKPASPAVETKSSKVIPSLKAEQSTPPADMKRVERTTPQPTSDTATVTTAPSTPVKTPPAQAERMPRTRYREELARLDSLVKAEMAKPVADRAFSPLAERFRVIAEQEQDEVARTYAAKRIEQIDGVIALADTIRKMNALDAEAELVRREHRSARAEMYQGLETAPVGLDARGELRVSAVYSGTSSLRRYRLVDPSTPYGRTIAYVELPPDSPLRAEDFLGQFVGIRASKTRLLAGSVDPVPVYVVSEFVPLPRPDAQSGVIETN